MPRRVQINMHAIDREFRRVLAKIDIAQRGADKSAQARLDALLRKVQGAHKQATSVCPKALSIWPEDAGTLRARSVKKPRRR